MGSGGELKYGPATRTIDLRASCLRPDASSSFVCHETFVGNWPAFCASHPRSHLCADHVPVWGRIAHSVRHALPYIPNVCAGLPGFSDPVPSPMPV